MAIQVPQNPSNGDLFPDISAGEDPLENGRVYVYDATAGVWKLSPSGGGGGGNYLVRTGDDVTATAPVAYKWNEEVMVESENDLIWKTSSTGQIQAIDDAGEAFLASEDPDVVTKKYFDRKRKFLTNGVYMALQSGTSPTSTGFCVDSTTPQEINYIYIGESRWNTYFSGIDVGCPLGLEVENNNRGVGIFIVTRREYDANENKAILRVIASRSRENSLVVGTAYRMYYIKNQN